MAITLMYSHRRNDMKKCIAAIIILLMALAPMGYAANVQMDALDDGSATVASTWYLIGYNATTPYRFTLAGALGLYTGSLGATGTRVTKGWFTNLEVTNPITIGGTAVPTYTEGTTITPICRTGAGTVGPCTDTAVGVMAGTGLTAGNVYYMASGGLTAANATNTTAMPAICVASTTTQCVYSGVVTTGSWTAGNIIYVSASAGALTATAPSSAGNAVQRVGVAVSATAVLVMPSLDVGTVQ
jgi:hypothetical protein